MFQSLSYVHHSGGDLGVSTRYKSVEVVIWDCDMQVEELHQQLLHLRAELPELLQQLATFDESQSSRQTFYNVAQTLAKWHSAAIAFADRYTELKASGALDVKSEPIEEIDLTKADEEPSEFDYGFNMDMMNDDVMGNEFMNDFDAGIGSDLTSEFLDLS